MTNEQATTINPIFWTSVAMPCQQFNNGNSGEETKVEVEIANKHEQTGAQLFDIISWLLPRSIWVLTTIGFTTSRSSAGVLQPQKHLDMHDVNDVEK